MFDFSINFPCLRFGGDTDEGRELHEAREQGGATLGRLRLDERF